MDDYCFIFDYYRDTPRGCGLKKGVIDPAEIRDKDVYVFVSHRHPDHYNRRIFSWRKQIPRIQYILSDDIKASEDVHFIHGGMDIQIGDIKIQALKSTDTGVAFVVQTDTTILYHAGDLNWWHWEGESARNNLKMEIQYKEQIDKLKDKQIDVAFVPVDPRLEKQALWGLTYLMQAVDVKQVIPMHFGEDSSIFEKIQKEKQADFYRERLLFMQKRGEKVSI